MKKLLFIFLLLAGFASLTACSTALPEETTKEVAQLIYKSGGFNNDPRRERIIDLQNAKVWIFEPVWNKNAKKYIERDPNAENEGYTLLCELTPEDVDSLRTVCIGCRFDLWEESYSHAGIMDGFHWKLGVVYADGTETTFTGSNLHPRAFAALADAVNEITGADVLSYHYLAK